MSMFAKVERMKQQAEENRKASPEMTAFIDLMKKEFDAKLDYLCVKGKEWGKQGERGLGIGQMVLTPPDAIAVPSRAKNTRFK